VIYSRLGKTLNLNSMNDSYDWNWVYLKWMLNVLLSGDDVY
jgi:hypothetical protein